MPTAPTPNGHIYYETHGSPGGMPLVLLEGGGAQLVGWPQVLLEELIDAGFWVITPDNRDVGLSTMFGGPYDLDGGYELSDMANDSLAVLGHLGLESAHLAGRSMGGILAQITAISHPERVRSLGLFYSIPNQSRRYVLHGDMPHLLQQPVRLSKDELVEGAVAAIYAKAPHADPWWEQETRRYLSAAYNRNYAPEGFCRQWAALKRATEDRLSGLAEVTVPTAVLHGEDDDHLHWHAALDIFETMPDAELHVYPGMGHWFHPSLHTDYVAALLRVALRGEQRLRSLAQ